MRSSVALALVVLGCGSSNAENGDPEGAKALLAEIRADAYQSWARAPGWPERMPTSAPHSEDVDIFVNPTLDDATKTPGIDSWPVGSIVAKDGYSGGELEIIAIMQKRTDGWFYAELSANGYPGFSGQPEVCTDCHDVGADFIRAFDFP
jgi:hypothetical protein